MHVRVGYDVYKGKVRPLLFTCVVPSSAQRVLLWRSCFSCQVVEWLRKLLHAVQAAVQFKPIPATLRQHESGAHVLDRAGKLLLEFANSTGARSYDWQGKITFALSVTEMASVFLVPGALGGAKGVQLLHDPNMQSDFQGQVLHRCACSPPLSCMSACAQAIRVAVSCSPVPTRQRIRSRTRALRRC